MSHFSVACQAYQTSPVACVTKTARIQDAYALMRERNISSLAATDSEGRVVGVLSLSDLLAIGKVQAGTRSDAHLLTLPPKQVQEVMSANVISVSESDSLHDAAKKMVKNRIHRVYVLDGEGRASAVVSTRDLILAVRDQRVSQPISQSMSSPVFSIRAEEPLATAVERLEKAHVSGLVVVEDHHPVGVFTRRDALWASDLARSEHVEAAMNPAILTLPPQTPLHRAAAQAAAMNVRRVIVCEGAQVLGLLSGLDFARVVAH